MKKHKTNVYKKNIKRLERTESEGKMRKKEKEKKEWCIKTKDVTKLTSVTHPQCKQSKLTNTDYNTDKKDKK